MGGMDAGSMRSVHRLWKNETNRIGGRNATPQSSRQRNAGENQERAVVTRYNLKARRQAVELRRDAVVHLRDAWGVGRTFKAIGYAVGISGEHARSIYMRELRARRQRLMSIGGPQTLTPERAP